MGQLGQIKEHNLDSELIDKINNSGGASVEKSNINGNIVINGEEITIYDDSDMMKKSEYASETNEGSVKKADEAKIIESIKNAQPGMYYGTNQDGEVGVYRLPFSKDTKQSGIYQMVLLNPPANSPQVVESIFDLNECKIFIQAYKFVAGEQDIVAILKEFNNGNKDSFYYDEENVEFDDGMKIKNQYTILSLLNGEMYESEVINKADFINGIEVV